jgi:hypothetical protein
MLFAQFMHYLQGLGVLTSASRPTQISDAVADQTQCMKKRNDT